MEKVLVNVDEVRNGEEVTADVTRGVSNKPFRRAAAVSERSADIVEQTRNKKKDVCTTATVQRRSKEGPSLINKKKKWAPNEVIRKCREDDRKKKEGLKKDGTSCG